jgi:2',3'-cyclic-nucleotide 2'-phosphodiesterase (5'-nucleotidase family)
LSGPIPEVLAAFRGEGERLVLTVFHFNDLHHHITVPHKTRGNTHFLAQMVHQVREARAAKGADEAVLFLSAGDDHTGTPFDELPGQRAEFKVDPVYRPTVRRTWMPR